MGVGELAIGIEKRWIMCHSLVQKFNRLRYLRFDRIGHRENVFRTRVKIERCDVGGWLAFDGRFLRSRDFRVKLRGDFLRDVALDCEHLLQIAIVFFGPYMRVSAGVNQLRIQMNSRSVPTHASFQNVGDTQSITDFPHILSTRSEEHTSELQSPYVI